jgi:hypothetical protein
MVEEVETRISLIIFVGKCLARRPHVKRDGDG